MTLAPLRPSGQKWEPSFGVLKLHLYVARAISQVLQAIERNILPAQSDVFEKYRSALISQPLSAVWRGHGSAIFLEFGRLHPQVRRDGAAASPTGDYSIMIEWSWRIESESAILCGSWSEEEGWEDMPASLVGREVEDISLFGRLPELSIALSGGLHVASFMTADGQPAWTIFDRSTEGRTSGWIDVQGGEVREDFDAQKPPVNMTGI